MKAKARLDTIRAKYGDKYFTSSPGSALAGGKGVTPKLGDGRLQAQTDTAKRPDYVGPPVSAPTPPPVAASNPSGLLPGLGGPPVPPATNGNAPSPDVTPPPVPEGEQPSLPAQ